MHAQMPLYKAISEMAVSAACEDPRFPKVKEKELTDINIEISVLTPMERITDWKQIRMGIDGVWIKRDGEVEYSFPRLPRKPVGTG